VSRIVNLSIVDPGMRTRIVCVAALAAAIAIIHLTFFRPFFTAIIYDEVAHLVSAKYVFTDIDLGYYSWTMKGQSLLLHILALPFGGLASYSPKEIYDLSWIANIAMSAVFVPLIFAFLRDFRISFWPALLGAATVASLPLFYIYTPLAMNELMFATLCASYLFTLTRFLNRPLQMGWPYFLLTLALTAAVTATKAAGTYNLVAACATAALLYRINPKTILLTVLSAIVIYLVRQTRMMFGYNLDISVAKVIPHLGVLAIGLTASICISLIYFAPLSDTATLNSLALRGPTSPLRGSWRGPAADQPDNAEWRAFNAFLIATFGFLMPSIAVSALFHALIDRFTNYRTVASTIPVFLIGILAFALVPKESGQSQPPRGRAFAAGMRVLIIIGLFATLFAMKALSRFFAVDNFFDFVTVLPVYDYMTQPFLSKASLWLLGLGACFAAASIFTSQAARMAGLIAANVVLLGCYLASAWSTDQDRAVFYGANLLMYDAVQSLEPKSVILLDFPPDVQWLHFGYPYAWRDAGGTKMPIVNAGSETVAGRGIGVVRFAVLNSEALHRVPAGRQQFLSYDLDKPSTHDFPRTAMNDIRARGNTANIGAMETFGSASFNLAQPNAMFGPVILPASATTRVTIWSAALVTEPQLKGCALVANAARWPLEIASAPSTQPNKNEWMLVADVKPVETLFGLLRIDCPVLTALSSGGRPVSLPLFGLAISQVPGGNR